MEYLLKALNIRLEQMESESDQLRAHLKGMQDKLEHKDGENEKLYALAMDYRNQIENLDKSANVANKLRVNDMQTIAKLQDQLEEATRDKTDLANEVQRLRMLVDSLSRQAENPPIMAKDEGYTPCPVNNPGPKIA